MTQQAAPIYKVLQTQMMSVNRKTITRLVVGDINTNKGRGVVIHGELTGFGVMFDVDEPLCVTDEHIEWMMVPNEYYRMIEVDDVSPFIL